MAVVGGRAVARWEAPAPWSLRNRPAIDHFALAGDEVNLTLWPLGRVAAADLFYRRVCHCVSSFRDGQSERGERGSFAKTVLACLRNAATRVLNAESLYVPVENKAAEHPPLFDVRGIGQLTPLMSARKGSSAAICSRKRTSTRRGCREATRTRMPRAARRWTMHRPRKPVLPKTATVLRWSSSTGTDQFRLADNMLFRALPDILDPSSCGSRA